MRVVILLCTALALCGCTDADWAHFMSYGSPEYDRTAVPPQPDEAAVEYSHVNAASTSPATVPLSDARMAAISEHCKSVATQRARDGSYLNFSDELQEQVYSGTYANCMKWKISHTY